MNIIAKHNKQTCPYCNIDLPLEKYNKEEWLKHLRKDENSRIGEIFSMEYTEEQIKKMNEKFNMGLNPENIFELACEMHALSKVTRIFTRRRIVELIERIKHEPIERITWEVEYQDTNPDHFR